MVLVLVLKLNLKLKKNLKKKGLVFGYPGGLDLG